MFTPKNIQGALEELYDLCDPDYMVDMLENHGEEFDDIRFNRKYRGSKLYDRKSRDYGLRFRIKSRSFLIGFIYRKTCSFNV